MTTVVTEYRCDCAHCVKDIAVCVRVTLTNKGKKNNSFSGHIIHTGGAFLWTCVVHLTMPIFVLIMLLRK